MCIYWDIDLSKDTEGKCICLSYPGLSKARVRECVWQFLLWASGSSGLGFQFSELNEGKGYIYITSVQVRRCTYVLSDRGHSNYSPLFTRDCQFRKSPMCYSVCRCTIHQSSSANWAFLNHKTYPHSQSLIFNLCSVCMYALPHILLLAAMYPS